MAISSVGENEGLQAWPDVFSAHSPPLTATFTARKQAVAHIALFDALENSGELAIELQHKQAAENNHLQLKLFHLRRAITALGYDSDARKPRLSAW